MKKIVLASIFATGMSACGPNGFQDALGNYGNLGGNYGSSPPPYGSPPGSHDHGPQSGYPVPGNYGNYGSSAYGHDHGSYNRGGTGYGGTFQGSDAERAAHIEAERRHLEEEERALQNSHSH